MSESNKKPYIILSAGGTGGHMTPAQALGRDLLSRGYEVALITDERGLKYRSMFEGIKIHTIRAGTLGAGIWGKVKGLTNLSVGVIQAFRILSQKRPDMVVGFGGYPSVPGVYAAQKMKIPTVIHEQNAIIGRANAYLAGRAERIAISLPDLQGLDETEKARAVFTGNPVRADISDLYTEPYPGFGQDGPLCILVMGGSLGATVFSDVVPQALTKLSGEYRERLHVVQQCREEDLDRVRAVYREAGIECDLAPFFDDVPKLLARAHLFIGRSGASTVAELATAGRPAIFVPYPHHKDQQQKINADSIADVGGAWVMTENGFTPDTLLARIETFFQNPSTLFKAAEKARTCGKPDAARKLGNLVTALVSGWGE